MAGGRAGAWPQPVVVLNCYMTVFYIHCSPTVGARVYNIWPVVLFHKHMTGGIIVRGGYNGWSPWSRGVYIYVAM